MVDIEKQKELIRQVGSDLLGSLQCTTCDWWFEPCELDDTQTCVDCGGKPDWL